MPTLSLTFILNLNNRTRSLFLTFFLFWGIIQDHPALGSAYQPSWPIFSEVQGGELAYEVKTKDSLYSISGRDGTAWEYLAKRNNLLWPFKLSIGQRLEINNRHIIPQDQVIEGLLLNIPGHMLYLFEQGALIKRFPVGLGRFDWPTPVGVFSVRGKYKNKTWKIPKSIQEEMRREGKIVLEKIPPGPDNPLGKYWIPLSVPGYGIHATIWPESIGHSTSHGCIRMLAEDIETLFPRIKPGTPITIVYEPLKLAITPNGRIFLEAHPNTYQKPFSYWNHAQSLARINSLWDQIDWTRVEIVLNERNGLAEEITRK
ncbi:MAG: L,D-transpeptidase family protein [Deltaproteobacteria bacterium]|nr:L,D-transpeptidase family protein [Deltaproteobacteria bacterium]